MYARAGGAWGRVVALVRHLDEHVGRRVPVRHASQGAAAVAAGALQYAALRSPAVPLTSSLALASASASAASWSSLVSALAASATPALLERACRACMRSPLVAQLVRYLTHTTRGFNLIEMLIAISIIVTFSSLVGTVYLRQLEESRIARAKIDVNSIQDALILYYTRERRYPLKLEELVPKGDLRAVPTDSWDNPYVYVPQVDWNLVLRAVQSRVGDTDIKYHTSCVELLARVVQQLPDKLDPMLIVAAAASGRVVFSRGTTQPIFPPDLLTASRDRIKAVAQMMKLCHERASSVAPLQEAIQSLMQLCAARAEAMA